MVSDCAPQVQRQREGAVPGFGAVDRTVYPAQIRHVDGQRRLAQLAPRGDRGGEGGRVLAERRRRAQLDAADVFVAGQRQRLQRHRHAGEAEQATEVIAFRLRPGRGVAAGVGDLAALPVVAQRECGDRGRRSLHLVRVEAADDVPGAVHPVVVPVTGDVQGHVRLGHQRLQPLVARHAAWVMRHQHDLPITRCSHHRVQRLTVRIRIVWFGVWQRKHRDLVRRKWLGGNQFPAAYCLVRCCPDIRVSRHRAKGNAQRLHVGSHPRGGRRRAHRRHVAGQHDQVGRGRAQRLKRPLPDRRLRAPRDIR